MSPSNKPSSAEEHIKELSSFLDSKPSVGFSPMRHVPEGRERGPGLAPFVFMAFLLFAVFFAGLWYGLRRPSPPASDTSSSIAAPQPDTRARTQENTAGAPREKTLPPEGQSKSSLVPEKPASPIPPTMGSSDKSKQSAPPVSVAVVPPSSTTRPFSEVKPSGGGNTVTTGKTPLTPPKSTEVTKNSGASTANKTPVTPPKLGDIAGPPDATKTAKMPLASPIPSMEAIPEPTRKKDTKPVKPAAEMPPIVPTEAGLEVAKNVAPVPSNLQEEKSMTAHVDNIQVLPLSLDSTHEENTVLTRHVDGPADITYTWTVDGTTVLQGIGKNTLVYTFSKPGSRTIHVTLSDGGRVVGQSEGRTVVTAIRPADYRVYANTVLRIDRLPSSFREYEWSIDGNKVKSDRVLEYTFTSPGRHRIDGYARNSSPSSADGPTYFHVAYDTLVVN